MLLLSTNVRSDMLTTSSIHRMKRIGNKQIMANEMRKNLINFNKVLQK